jgi:hypothetical protein
VKFDDPTSHFQSPRNFRQLSKCEIDPAAFQVN